MVKKIEIETNFEEDVCFRKNDYAFRELFENILQDIFFQPADADADADDEAGTDDDADIDLVGSGFNIFLIIDGANFGLRP